MRSAHSLPTLPFLGSLSPQHGNAGSVSFKSTDAVAFDAFAGDAATTLHRDIQLAQQSYINITSRAVTPSCPVPAINASSMIAGLLQPAASSRANGTSPFNTRHAHKPQAPLPSMNVSTERTPLSQRAPSTAPYDLGAHGALDVLDFSNSDLIFDRGANNVVGALQSAMHRGLQLRELVLSGNKLYRSGAAIIADALQWAPCLESLNLAGNKIGAHGLSHLLRAVHGHDTPVLHTLNLNDNDLGYQGMVALVESLLAAPSPDHGLSQITHLSLASNGLHGHSITLLARAIPLFPQLESLDVSHNEQMTTTDIRTLQDAMRRHPRLQQIIVGEAAQP